MPIKLVIFDLDGVLVDAKDIHFAALNEAIRDINPNFEISIEEHLSKFDGLPTSIKLRMLTELKGLPEHLYDKLWQTKQNKTKILFNQLQPDLELKEILSYLKNEGIKVCVASNSIRETVLLALDKLEINNFFDLVVSNEDVKNCKPHPEMHMKCMTETNSLPDETIIIEDSPVGRKAAVRSGANLLPIKNRRCLNKDLIIKEINKHNLEKTKWIDRDLNILIPMAGFGSRFFDCGYKLPKPLIEVYGKPMIQLIVDNINIEANYIFICLKEHYEKYNLKQLLNLIYPGCNIVLVDKVTEGAACTSLLAEDLINNDKSLLIANSDQYITWDSSNVMYGLSNNNIDGGILTFNSSHPKWSYAKLENGLVKEVAEKKVISNEATVGIYYWRKGSDYVKYAKQMICHNKRVNNEFYICPVFNEAINDNKKIYTKKVDEMWGIGTPEDLEYFLKNGPKWDVI